MNFVLDTNAVSESRKQRPNSGLLNWLCAQDRASLFITTVTLAEVWQGFHKLGPEHADYDSVKQFAFDLPQQYRILNFDRLSAEIWGKMTAATRGPLPVRDSFIAAIVRSRGYRIVTRDSAVFERMGCRVVDPWR